MGYEALNINEAAKAYGSFGVRTKPSSPSNRLNKQAPARVHIILLLRPGVNPPAIPPAISICNLDLLARRRRLNELQEGLLPSRLTDVPSAARWSLAVR